MVEPEIRVPIPQDILWGKRVVQILQWFVVSNGPGAGAKNF